MEAAVIVNNLRTSDLLAPHGLAVVVAVQFDHRCTAIAYIRVSTARRETPRASRYGGSDVSCDYAPRAITVARPAADR
jgi:hypothetical protein